MCGDRTPTTDAPDQGEPELPLTRVYLVLAALGLAVVLGAVVLAARGSPSTRARRPLPSGSSGEEADTGRAVDGTCLPGDDCAARASRCAREVCVAGTCRYEATRTVSCRPQLDITEPERGATIRGEPGSTVTVAGSVRTGIGAVVSLTLNGADVPRNARGEFSVEVAAQFGGNTLVFEVTDDNGWTRRRVQSFVWSTRFGRPAQDAFGKALAVRVGPGALAVVADGVQRVVDGIAVTPALSAAAPVAAKAGYEVFVTDVGKGEFSLALNPVDGGVRVEAGVADVSGGLRFDCTEPACALLGGDDTGRFGVASVDVSGELFLGVDADGEFEVGLRDLEIGVGEVSVSSAGAWTNFLLKWARPKIAARVGSVIQTELRGALWGTLRGAAAGRPLQTSRLVTVVGLDPQRSARSVGLALQLTRLDAVGGPDFAGSITVRGGATAADVAAVETYMGGNLGVPDSAGCGRAPSPLGLRGGAPLQLAIADDLLNQILYMAWRGGSLQFTLPGSGARVHGLLAPMWTDCDGGAPRVFVGGLGVEGDGFVARVTCALAAEIVAEDGGLALVALSVAWMKTEVSATRDDTIAEETAIAQALQRELQEHLLRRWGGAGGLASARWPALDLSAIAGASTGATVLSVSVDSVRRGPGHTIVAAHL